MSNRKLPKLTLGLRMLIAQEAAGYGSGQMAKKLGVSRHSVSGWLADRHVPNQSTLVEWARLCGDEEGPIDLDWLKSGQIELDASLDEAAMRAQLAQALVAQLLGDKSPDLLRDLTLAELDLMPDLIDLTKEPAVVVQIQRQDELLAS